jgi:hypothetical protein
VKSKFEIQGLEELLAKFPEDEREEARKEIEQAFENFDPENPTDKEVIHLRESTGTCPTCKGPLTCITKGFAVPTVDGDEVPCDLVECLACDETYTIPATN